LTTLIGTWNVGNAPPSHDLSSWLPRWQIDEAGLIAIGAQECEYATETDNTCQDEWVHSISLAIGASLCECVMTHIARVLARARSLSLSRPLFFSLSPCLSLCHSFSLFGVHSIGLSRTLCCSLVRTHTTHTNTYTNTRKQKCRHTPTHTNTYKHIHTHTDTCKYITTHTTHTNTYMHIQIHANTYKHIQIHTYTYIYIHTHTNTYKHIHTHTNTHKHMQTHANTYIHIQAHTNIQTHTYTYIHVQTHTYTYIHIHTHAYTYKYIHTHTYTYIRMTSDLISVYIYIYE